MKLQGFYDSHLHLLGLGYVKTMIDLSQYDTIEDIRKFRSNKDVILGRGWHQNQFGEKRMPTKQDLNEISTSKPIVFIRVCGHVIVCNDKAMALANIHQASPQIEGGTFDFDTGIFTEDALGIIYDILPKPNKKALKEMFVEGNKELLENGITSCASDDFSTIDVPYELIIECLEELYNDGLMQVRLYEQVNLPSLERLQDFIDKGYVNKQFNGFRMGPLKLLADGSLGGRTAYLNDDYSDDPGNRGIKVFSDKELYDLIYLADSNNMDVAIHAIGDGIIDIILDTIELVTSKTGRTNHRHSIIHNQLATKKQIKRMARMKIMAIVQPIFINSDLAIIEDRMGKRTKETYLFHTMKEEGLKVGFSTDSPVEPVNPFYNIYTAMTRKSIKNPELKPLLNERLFSLNECLACYTSDSYYHSYDENNTFNDYVIIDKDISNIDVEDIKDVTVLETYIDGKLVYKKEDLNES